MRLCLHALFVSGIAATAITTPAQASNYKSFVSSAGVDTNICTIGAPCHTISHALSQTVGGGVVSCLDSGDYSEIVTISTSVTIDCGATTAGFGPFTINGANIDVTIKNGLIFDEYSTGIAFLKGAKLTVDNVSIATITTGASAAGIAFTPAAPGGKLSVHNTHIESVGVPSSGAFTGGFGLIVQPTGSGSVATVDIDNTWIEYCAEGIYINAGAGTQVNLEMRDSRISQQAWAALAAYSSGGNTYVNLDHNTFSNSGYGVYSSGAGSYVFLSNSLISGNSAGLVFDTGGHLVSYANNHVSLNSVDGSPSATTTAK